MREEGEESAAIEEEEGLIHSCWVLFCFWQNCFKSYFVHFFLYFGPTKDFNSKNKIFGECKTIFSFV